MRQSRMVKSANVGRGTGRLEDAAPNICVKRLSLYKQSARFEPEVATNLEVPAVVLVTGVLERVEEAVSIELAVR